MHLKETSLTDLNWRESYRIGNNRIDKQHQNLFKIAAEAFSVVNPKEKKNKIKNIIERLLTYTKEHFAYEERFMASVDYPLLGVHKHKHHLIINSMNKFIKEIRSKSIGEIEHELAHFIEVWFIGHIIHEDKKISQWASKQTLPEHAFVWKKRYSINEPEIDEEHKELFQIADEAFKNVSKSEKREKIKASLNKLFEYFEKHFKNEELFMEKIQYNRLEEHKQIHQDIIDKLNDFVKKSPTMSIDQIEEDLETFIENSLIEHIVHEDSQIASWQKFLEDLKTAKELKEI